MIPVPYGVLHLAIGILTSKRILSIANRSICKGEGEKNFQIPDMSRHDLKPLLIQLKELKGLLLVDIILKEGTEISIKL